jgi:lipoprotein-releasing system ATP-binding protein
MTSAMQSTGTSFLLVAQSLTKIYRGVGADVTVFQDLNFTLRKGEMVAIVGASGAGKSTLLHLLGGLDQPTSGTVIWDDFDIFKNGELQLAALRNRRIGFVFQFHHLLPEFSALENVMMPLLIGGRKRIEAVSRAQDLLRRVGLETRLAHRPGELSGGERQRVALARALVTSPSLLLADEPTGNLDQRTGEEVFAMIRQLHAEEHLTSILVTHNEQLAATCDRVLHLANGILT